MIAPDGRPCLAPKVRLRRDGQSDRTLLLYPERGLLLNPTAADIACLCTGEHTVAEIVDRLAVKYTGRERAAVEREVLAFLGELGARGLLRPEAAAP